MMYASNKPAGPAFAYAEPVPIKSPDTRTEANHGDMIVPQTTLRGAMAADVKLRLEDRFVVGIMLIDMR
jgi:hypothetical protein